MEIKSLCNQVENFIRVTVGPKNPKNAFKVAVSLTTKVSQIGPPWVAEILGAGYLTFGVKDTAILKAFWGYFGPTVTLIKFSTWLLKDLISMSNPRKRPIYFT